MNHTFERKSRIEHPIETVFAWHEREGALQRLTPPWQKVELLERTGTIRDGDRVKVRLWVANIPLEWLVEHRDYQPNRQFRDVQIKGPFAHWTHTHRFEPVGDVATLMTDHIAYAVPGGIVGDGAFDPMLRNDLARGFAYRHATLARDLDLHRDVANGRSLTIAVSGATGFIGSALVPLLTAGGNRVVRIVRSEQPVADAIAWSPRSGFVDADALEGVDAIVHLAGESILGRWTDDKKDRIRRSRVDGTRALAEAIAKLDRKPAVLVAASAIGYYGSRGDETLTEESPRGTGFLADVSEGWERATDSADDAGVRVVNLRIPVVLDPRGGMLGKTLTPFKLGLGGVVGSGEQFLSWITLEDLLRIVYHAIFDHTLRGPINACAPDPVTNREFTKALGTVLGRPTVVPAPAAALRLIFGDEMPSETMLASQRVQPVHLAKHAFGFLHPQIEPALRFLLGQPAPA